MQKFKAYKKSDSHSYAIGIYPTIELLIARPQSIEAVFVAPQSHHSQGVQKIIALCKKYDVPCIEDVKTIARVAHDSHSFAMAAFKKFHNSLESNMPHVVLVNPDDAGNLGTVLRTMLGLGHHNLAVISPAADHFDPKVIRASMGAVFKQRVSYFDTFDAYATKFPEHHIYPFVLQTDNLLGNTRFDVPYSLVFGNEGAGLPAAFTHLGTPVRIEQTAEVDSLNLAISASIALYAAFTQK